MADGTKMSAEAAGKLKGGAKALAGYPGIFHHLAGEHAEVSTLMKRVAASDESSDERDELFPEIRKNLLAHAKGEEQVFYPQLESHPELKTLVERSLEQHQDIEQKLESLASADKHTSGWTSEFKALMEAVENHVAEEEQNLFPRANEALENQQAREMEDDYEAVEEREKERLS